MGYTHYWTQTRDFNADEMQEIGAAILRIIDTSEVTIGDARGESLGADIVADNIMFNGWNDMAHETFCVPATRELPYDGADPDRLGWSVCKTARKPYDIVVTAALTYLANKWGFEVSSDGEIADWEAGVALAERALDTQFYNPLVVELLTQA